MLIVYKIAHGVCVGQGASLLHSLAVVPVILPHVHALLPQQVFLPLPRVGGHVHHGPIAQRGGHDADGKSQISRGAHLHRVVCEKVPLPGKVRVISVRAKQPGLQSQLLRVLEHLVNPAPCLDGACHRQLAVQLQKQPSGRDPLPPAQLLPQSGQFPQGRLNPPAVRLRLRKQAAQQRREAVQPVRRVVHLARLHRQTARHGGKGPLFWVNPTGFRRCQHIPQCRVLSPRGVHTAPSPRRQRRVRSIAFFIRRPPV
ncbi:hypothetical protein SDC9_169729 [bioreactor metagenome]|uniref:Uncharacterized protein n=1 Tax=bioreactor metagenome TaxID=1076179 RepID=A0A645G889_9ZZZZ